MKNFYLIIIFLTSLSYSQIANRWQPDSVYENRKVKKILVFLNSPEDISEIVEFDKNGKRTRKKNYSASYDNKSRENKRIYSISHYIYNQKNTIKEIVDSIYHFGNISSVDRTVFFYEKSGQLILKKLLKDNYREDYRTTRYSYNPFKTNLIIRNDSVITLDKTQEYDKNFYVSRDYGFYLQPKVKHKEVNIDEQGYENQYTFLERYDTDLYYNNKFDKKENLKSSNLKARVKNKWKRVYKLKYEYYPNGLLKSITGYVPRYFKYEFWD